MRRPISTTASTTAGKEGVRLTRRRLDGGGEEGGSGGGGALGVLSAALEGFRPDLVIISPGLDGRKGHPCGRGDLVAKDYEWLTREVSGIGGGGVGGDDSFVGDGGGGGSGADGLGSFVVGSGGSGGGGASFGVGSSSGGGFGSVVLWW